MSEENKIGSVDLTNIASPEQVIVANLENEAFAKSVISINDFPAYQPEEKNPDILVKGRWLERGGSAWWVSTAGTGKSIASIQLAYKWGVGLDFAGLQPHRPLRSWIIQSEDSPSRVTIDREDVTAELHEKYPEINWSDVGKECVKFVKIPGKVGVAFLEEIDRLLTLANKSGKMPDVLIINPFMAFVGGPVTDGGYVTPFLRGGEIDNRHTDGLQFLLEKHNVAALIFHHTPKPPTEKELDGWLKSMFPEYQGAGSSDITNWGRSFITMMKVKGHSRMVCMVAGKNGGEIGWEEINGSRRKYMAWSDGDSITGGRRHAWRDLTPDEYDDVVGKEKSSCEDAVSEKADRIAERLKQNACTINSLERSFSDVPRRLLRPALAIIKANPSKFRLSRKTFLVGKQWITFIGLVDGIEKAVKLYRQQAGVDAANGKDMAAETVMTPTVVTTTKDNADEEPSESIDLPF